MTPGRVKESKMKNKNIETVVMINNYLGKEATLAAVFEIKYQQFVSAYDEETNSTTIHYVFYTE